MNLNEVTAMTINDKAVSMIIIGSKIAWSSFTPPVVDGDKLSVTQVYSAKQDGNELEVE